MANPWQLRVGNIDEAIAYLQEAYQRQKTPMWATSLGVAYLWAGQYQTAWTHFMTAIDDYRMSNALFYGMAGVARWCVGEPSEAVRSWQDGLRADHADNAGGIHLPMLLFLGSTLDPIVFSRQQAEELLRKRSEDPRAENWPGPLGRFLLGQIGMDYLLNAALWHNSIPPQRKWLINFYDFIIALRQEDRDSTEFKSRMLRFANASGPEWSKEEDFARLLRNAEFFVARYEAFRQ